MAIELELKTKRTPCGHTHITKASILNDEGEIVVKAFSLSRLKIGLMVFFVMPGFVGWTGFHCTQTND